MHNKKVDIFYKFLNKTSGQLVKLKLGSKKGQTNYILKWMKQLLRQRDQRRQLRGQHGSWYLMIHTFRFQYNKKS